MLCYIMYTEKEREQTGHYSSAEILVNPPRGQLNSLFFIFVPCPVFSRSVPRIHIGLHY